MNRPLRWLFFRCVVRPLVLVVLGLNVRRRDQLPSEGPAILVANHNSHLDALALMTLFPQRLLPRVQPVAAADYFLRSRPLAWLATQIIGIIPLDRNVGSARRDPLAPMVDALQQGQILILFPEGSRGEPEERAELKTGIAHLAKRHPEVPVIPVYLHGLGKALPKGEGLLVPFFVDVFVGDPIEWDGDRPTFMQTLESRFDSLESEAEPAAWM